MIFIYELIQLLNQGKNRRILESYGNSWKGNYNNGLLVWNIEQLRNAYI